MDRLGGQWWSLNSNQFIATASSFTTHDDYCCGMNTIFKNWLKSARYCQVFFLEYIEYIRIPINPPRSYIAPGHLGVYPWADGPLLRLTFFRPCHRWATNCAAGSKHWKGRRTRHLAPSLWLWTRCLRNGDLGWIGWVMIFCFFFLWFWASNKWIGSDSGQTASKSYRNTQL